jgi:hypothetical protein
MSESNWLAPQHPLCAAETEPASMDDELAEQIEAILWRTFRAATTAQVEGATRGVRLAAIRYAESWTRTNPRRQIPS